MPLRTLIPLALLVAGLSACAGLLAPPPAGADVGVVGLSPKEASPGQEIDLRIGCGSCHAGVRFPVSLVPLARAPRPHPCGANALCAPSAAKPPRRAPFVLLGRTAPARATSDSRPPGTESRLRFQVPSVKPGPYAFVIFCASCLRGPRGSLIVDTSDPRRQLRVVAEATPESTCPLLTHHMGGQSTHTSWVTRLNSR